MRSQGCERITGTHEDRQMKNAHKLYGTIPRMYLYAVMWESGLDESRMLSMATQAMSDDQIRDMLRGNDLSPNVIYTEQEQ